MVVGRFKALQLSVLSKLARSYSQTSCVAVNAWTRVNVATRHTAIQQKKDAVLQDQVSLSQQALSERLQVKLQGSLELNSRNRSLVNMSL